LNALLGSFAGMTFGFREFLSQHNITLAGTPLEVEELMFRKVTYILTDKLRNFGQK
jgi:hypothetical protein